MLESVFKKKLQREVLHTDDSTGHITVHGRAS